LSGLSADRTPSKVIGRTNEFIRNTRSVRNAHRSPQPSNSTVLRLCVPRVTGVAPAAGVRPLLWKHPFPCGAHRRPSQQLRSLGRPAGSQRPSSAYHSRRVVHSSSGAFNSGRLCYARSSISGGGNMNFISIDVETANADMTSICSIGAAVFENGKLADEWYTLIEPNDYFDPIHVSIHGIEADTVRGAPTFDLMATHIDRLVGEGV